MRALNYSAMPGPGDLSGPGDPQNEPLHEFDHLAHADAVAAELVEADEVGLLLETLIDSVAALEDAAQTAPYYHRGALLELRDHARRAVAAAERIGGAA